MPDEEQQPQEQTNKEILDIINRRRTATQQKQQADWNTNVIQFTKKFNNKDNT